MMDIHIDILSPEWSRSLEADAVFLPGTCGEFEVLRNHAPIISTLSHGRIRWRVAEKEESLDIKGGVVRLKDNRMQICIQL